MNCIGHSFLGNEDTLFRVKALLEKIESSKIIATPESIELYKFKLSYKLNRPLDIESKLSLLNKEWIKSITNVEAVLFFSNKVQLQNRVSHLQMSLKEFDLRMRNLNVESSYYIKPSKHIGELIINSNEYLKIQNRKLQKLIFDQELSA